MAEHDDPSKDPNKVPNKDPDKVPNKDPDKDPNEDPNEDRREGRERREMARLPIELRVEYRRLNSFFADYTKNISKGGTFIRTAKPLPPGTEFVFVLTVPKLGEPLRLNGEVVWTVDPARATEESPAGMGIRFKYVDGDERAATERVVEGLIRGELGEHVSDRLLGASEPPANKKG